MDIVVFSKISCFEEELKKIAILRIILGTIAFTRFSEIIYTAILLDVELANLVYGIGMLSAILFFTIGFITPLATLFIIFFSIYIDYRLEVFSLGTCIFSITAIPFLLINSAQYYSVDRLLVIRKNIFSDIFKYSFTLVKADSISDIRRAYFLVFVIYAMISFSAFSLHVKDEFWTSGLTIKALFVNSYLCKQYKIFRYVEENFIGVLTFVSILSGILQSIFQCLMLPLIFFNFGRVFVKIFGFIFFIISLLFMSLSHLPHVEIIMWTLIFIPAKSFIQTTDMRQRVGFSLISDFIKNIFVKGQFLLKDNSNKNDIVLILNSINIIKKSIFIYFISLNLFFLIFKMPYSPSKTPYLIDKALRYVGYIRPNVFNRADLSMGNHWMEIYRVDRNGLSLLPFMGKDGERLNYMNFDILKFTNHNSDILYFGTSSRFARSTIQLDRNGINELMKKGNLGWVIIKKIIKYDYRYHKYKGNKEYLLKVNQNSQNNISYEKINTNIFEKEVLFSKKYIYDGREMSSFD